MDIGFAATLQDSASSLYRNNITPLLQRCASYMGEPRTEASMASVDTKRALQQEDNLKWQQDMFHRLLNLVCLSREGLVPQQQVGACKRQVLAFLESPHPDGEWADFTRNKLLFLQDLLFATCISENEYHISKKPLILRLADQGAIIDAEDFIFNSSAACDAKVMRMRGAVRTTSSRRARARSMTESDTLTIPAYKTDTNAGTKAAASSPLNQVMGTVCQVNKMSYSGGGSRNATTAAMKMEKESRQPRVPHALDFLRPEHCPVRDPPSPHQLFQKPVDISISISKDKQEEPLAAPQPAPSADDLKDGHVCNTLSPFSSPNHTSIMTELVDPFSGHASPFERGPARNSPSRTPSRFKNMLTGLIQKKRLQSESEKSPKSLYSSKGSDSEEEEKKNISAVKGTKWGLDMLRFPKKLHFDQEEQSTDNAVRTSLEPVHGCTGVQLAAVEGGGGQGPNIRRLKKKVHSKGAPTDFFIDKVLGENIKNELSSIRAEMNRTQPGQNFTNEQIDAIATRLPVDKAELKKFFPRTWCEKYGDIVLQVVQKEFKEHVGEMQRLGKAVKDKHQRPTSSSPLKHNDENMEGSSSPLQQHHHQLPRRKPDFTQCFTTLNENMPANNIPWGSSPRKQQQPAGTTESPIKEMNRCTLTPQQRCSRRLSRDMTSAEDNLDCKLEEEILKMPFRRLHEYGSHLRL